MFHKFTRVRELHLWLEELVEKMCRQCVFRDHRQIIIEKHRRKEFKNSANHKETNHKFT